MEAASHDVERQFFPCSLSTFSVSCECSGEILLSLTRCHHLAPFCPHNIFSPGKKSPHYALHDDFILVAKDQLSANLKFSEPWRSCFC